MMTLTKIRIHEVNALLGHLSTIIALCVSECEVPWRGCGKVREAVLSLTNAAPTCEHVPVYAAQDWTEPCFLSLLLLLRADKHSAVSREQLDRKSISRATYHESSLHSRQVDHSRDRDAISALLKTALSLSSETGVERCTPSGLFLSAFLL
jgi:hypothetical protein